MAVTLIQQSRTVQGGAQVVDRDEGLMAVTPIQQSRTVLGWLVCWLVKSLTTLSTQCRSYRAFKVELYSKY